MTINIVQTEQDKRDYLPEIQQRLQTRFLKIKERNPRGYLDQWDSQFDNICMEVATEMGGRTEYRNNELVFNFSPYSVEQLQPV